MPLNRISQTQLDTAVACPRKFQHIYLEQFTVPPTITQLESLQWGQQFHRLLQQKLLGLSIQPLLERDPTLQRYVSALESMLPEVFKGVTPDSVRRFSEHARQYQQGDVILPVIYDLLLLWPDRAEIIDWKTYPRPQTATNLAQHWQTRLYRYVLVETTNYAPEAITMTYWFVQGRQPLAKPERLQFPYDTNQHQRTRSDLAQLLQQINDWTEQHQSGVDLPQVDVAKGECDRCPFSIRCDRVPSQTTSSEQLQRLLQITASVQSPD